MSDKSTRVEVGVFEIGEEGGASASTEDMAMFSEICIFGLHDAGLVAFLSAVHKSVENLRICIGRTPTENFDFACGSKVERKRSRVR